MRYRSEILVPGRKRPWTEESESEVGIGSRVAFRVVATTVAASVGSRVPPQAEQRRLVSEFSVAQSGQVFIIQWIRSESCGKRISLNAGENAVWSRSRI